MKPIEKAACVPIREDLRSLLVCPACRSDLSFAADRIHCSNAACRRFKSGFPIVQGIPALIDFDRSIIAEDVLLATQVQSTVARGGSLWRRLAYRMRHWSGVQSGLDDRAGALLDHVRNAANSNALVLIVGGGTVSPNSPFRNARDIGLISCDIYKSDSTDVLADGHFLPFRDAVFDGVAAQAVLERRACLEAELAGEAVVHQAHRDGAGA